MRIESTFAQLFKFFRLKSGFKTISHFANTLAEEGLAYDNSLFSHWQRGSRVPSNRNLLLILIKIFNDNNSMLYIEQANLFLKSAKKINLTTNELANLPNLISNQKSSSWKMELEKFIYLDLDNKKHQLKNINNKKHRFNFILSPNDYSYFSKIAKKQNISKATFLRKLIEDHRRFENI